MAVAAMMIGGLFASSASAAADAKSEAVLKNMANFFVGLKSFRSDSFTRIELSLGQMGTQQMGFGQIVAMERPMKFHASAKSALMSYVAVCDGESVTLYDGRKNEYQNFPAPKDLSQIQLSPDLKKVPGGFNSFKTITALVASDPYAQLVAADMQVSYVGTETVKGQACDVLNFVTPKGSFKAWIRQGSQPVFQRIVPDMSTVTEQIGPLGNAKVSAEIEFKRWQFNQPIDPTLWTFTPPEGARNVTPSTQPTSAPAAAESVGGQGDAAGAEVPSPLIGQPAPAGRVPILKGGVISTGRFKGKAPVVVLFWTPASEASCEALAKVHQMSRADKTFELIPVAVKAAAKDVQKAMVQRKIAGVMAIDRRAEMAKAYGVQGVPMAAVIDKGGVVRAVIRGFGPDAVEKIKAGVAQ
jgi:peroxiredoxin